MAIFALFILSKTTRLYVFSSMLLISAVVDSSGTGASFLSGAPEFISTVRVAQSLIVRVVFRWPLLVFVSLFVCLLYCLFLLNLRLLITPVVSSNFSWRKCYNIIHVSRFLNLYWIAFVFWFKGIMHLIIKFENV